MRTLIEVNRLLKAVRTGDAAGKIDQDDLRRTAIEHFRETRLGAAGLIEVCQHRPFAPPLEGHLDTSFSPWQLVV